MLRRPGATDRTRPIWPDAAAALDLRPSYAPRCLVNNDVSIEY